MLRKLIAITILLGVLILIAGVVLWMQRLTPQSHRFVLSTGTIVTFNQATFGTNHVISTGGRWSKFLPKFIARRFLPRGSSSIFSTPSPSVMLWFESRQMAGANTRDYQCSVVHADGTETSLESSRRFANWTPTNRLEGVSSPYPQREKVLRLRFYEMINYDDATLLGEFTLRNPNVSRAPRKTAPPLPQTDRDKDLEVTLTALVSPVRRGKWEKTNFLNQWSRATFRVEEAGRPSTNWSVQQMVATDSTGNKLTSHSWSSGTRNGIETYECKPMLWPSEWYRLRFEFSRKPTAPFETNEVWTIRGVAVPTNGGFTLVNTQWNAGKFTVLFHGLVSMDGRPPWDRLIGGEAALGFSVMPQPEGHRFTLLQVTDDLGLIVENSGFGSSGTNWGLGLKIKDGVQSLEVKVALHRSRFVEFQAQPANTDEKF